MPSKVKADDAQTGQSTLLLLNLRADFFTHRLNKGRVDKLPRLHWRQNEP